MSEYVPSPISCPYVQRNVSIFDKNCPYVRQNVPKAGFLAVVGFLAETLLAAGFLREAGRKKKPLGFLVAAFFRFPKHKKTKTPKNAVTPKKPVK